MKRQSPGWFRWFFAVVAVATLTAALTLNSSGAQASGVFSEQQGHLGANTFTNFHNASGLGAKVAPGQRIDVSCKVYDPTIQSVNPDGYWYRIASAPWDNHYYSAANTFMNGDPWGGPYTHNTDWSVPDCTPTDPAPTPSPTPPPPPSPTVNLQRGDAADVGYWYDVELRNFEPSTVVSVSCSDSRDGAFRSFMLLVATDGSASTNRECRSGDGPDHWVVAQGVESNHVSWVAPPPATTTTPPPKTPRATQTPAVTQSEASSSPKPDFKFGDVCIQSFPGGGQMRSHAIFGGTESSYDRVASLYQVCSGFGAPDGLQYKPQMQCALIAAAATYGGAVLSVGTSKGCDIGGFAQDAFVEKDWLGAGGGLACGYFSEVLAGGLGILSAGATAETGPGAVAVGVSTYKALAAYFKVACGGLLDGGANALGYNLESKHETAVALDIIKKGRCLRERQVFGFVSWSASTC